VVGASGKWWAAELSGGRWSRSWFPKRMVRGERIRVVSKRWASEVNGGRRSEWWASEVSGGFGNWWVPGQVACGGAE